MGISFHNLHLLAHAQDLGARFTRTLGIGRQGVFVDPRELQQFAQRRGLPPLSAAPAGQPLYYEPLLQQWFGAEQVDAVDASPYEGARFVHDMNQPWPASATEGYDAVLDYGCLEHVFNFPVAWRNVVDHCRVGGHVLHALPANNLSGHGFYQFSPELFFNLYRPENGFELQGLFFSLAAEPRAWWRVANPMQVRRRVNLCNGHEVYMLVVAKKLREPGVLATPQQSDYAQIAWQGGSAQPAASISRLQQPLAALGLLDAARRMRDRLQGWRGAGLSLPAPDYERVELATLLARKPA